MLNVNTIEFNGRKACINSYSDHPALMGDMNKQRENWAATYPKATVKTERMSIADAQALVAADKTAGTGRNAAYEIGQSSNG